MSESFYVYCLYQQSRIVYIGSTINLDARVSSHCADKIFDAVKYCILPTYESMLSFESYGISKLKPFYNRVIPSVDKKVEISVNWLNYCLKDRTLSKTLPEYSRSCQNLTIPSKFLSANQFCIGDNYFTLSVVDKVIYSYIHQHFSNGWRLPTYGEIGMDLGIPTKTVGRTFQYLKKLGVIRIKNVVGNKSVLLGVEDVNNLLTSTTAMLLSISQA